jgi:hypothetical protein
LKGNSIGLLGVTLELPEQNTPKISGWIRPVASVARLSLEAADICRAPFMNVIEEVRPTIRVQFNDGETVEFSAAKCFSELARQQVFNFVDRLIPTAGPDAGRLQQALGDVLTRYDELGGPSNHASEA